MMKPNLLLLVTLVVAAPLASCSSAIKVPDRVSVEVPVACVKEKPERPDVLTPEQLLELPRGVRTVAAWLNMLKLAMYAAELEAVVEGCARIPEVPAGVLPVDQSEPASLS